MRAGKRQKLVEAKRTRSCVVRLQKVHDLVQVNKNKSTKLPKKSSEISKKNQLAPTIVKSKIIKKTIQKPFKTQTVVKVNEKDIKTILLPTIVSREVENKIKSNKLAIVENKSSYGFTKSTKPSLSSSSIHSSNNNNVTNIKTISGNNNNNNITITKLNKSGLLCKSSTSSSSSLPTAKQFKSVTGSSSNNSNSINNTQNTSNNQLIKLPTNKDKIIKKNIIEVPRASIVEKLFESKYQSIKKLIGSWNSIEEELRPEKSEMSAKSKARGKPRKSTIAAATASSSYETPPTIAAGRSRRAIKPNPKYASDDVVTPKIMKNVVNNNLNYTPHRKNDNNNRTRHDSSSSDDFFNKDSDDDDDDDIVDKKKNFDKVYELTPAIDVPTPKRKRGRPKKSDMIQQQTQAANISTRRTPVTTPRSQLQQLRKTLLSSNTLAVARYDQQQALKRKLETQLKLDEPITKKMLLQTTSKYKSIDSPATASTSTSAKTPQTRKIITSNANINKITINSRNDMKSSNTTATTSTTTTTTTNSNNNFDPKTALVPYGSTVSRIHSTLAGTSNASGNATNLSSNMVNNACKTIRVVTPKYSNASKLPSQAIALKNETRRSLPVQQTLKALPAPPTPPSTQKSSSANNSRHSGGADENKIEASPSSTIDDFETMPTFTIVNIHDIINKKGDVLITKAGAKNLAQKAAKAKTSIDFEKSNEDEVTSSTSPVETKSNRRKSPHATANNNSENDPIVNPPTLTRAQVIQRKFSMLPSNSTLNKAVSSSTDRPAPRILNSVVGKRTQPIKPMISNVSSSYNNSDGFSMSLDDDDDDVRHDVAAAAASRAQQLASTTTSSTATTTTTTTARKYPTLAAAKAALVSSKENSLSVGNTLMSTTSSSSSATSPRTPRLRLNNDLTVSRLGSKVVKKMTCFETWYVININEIPNKIVRNVFEIPLIKLANSVNDVKMPSTYWSNKVTLFEVPSVAINKSALITYEGDLNEHNISEEDRHKYQPSCVMFRRAVNDRIKSRLPYDRAVIFKNRTFFTNIEGKNIKLVGAPSTITTISDIEILLQIVDTLSLHSQLVEPTSTI